MVRRLCNLITLTRCRRASPRVCLSPSALCRHRHCPRSGYRDSRARYVLLRLPDLPSAYLQFVAFKKSSIPNQLEQVGVSRGWGYLLCDEGSAYSIGRLAIRSILAHEDARQSVALSPSSVAPPRAMLNLHRDLLKYFDVPDTATLIDKVYSNHAPSANPRGYSSAEANRKIWIAEATRLVFARAFTSSKADEQEGGENFQSQQEAIAITTEAIKPLIDIVERLLGDRSVVVPSRSLLSLGGGLWKVDGYRNMLLNGLSELGIVFEHVIVVADASEEGVIALSMQCATTNGVH